MKNLFFSLLPRENVTAVHLVAFLRDLARHLPGPLVLLWDRLAAHRAHPVREWLERCPRVRAESFPAYAPELNPAEFVWGYLKLNPLANHAAVSADFLAATTRRHLRALRQRQGLLRSLDLAGAAVESSPIRTTPANHIQLARVEDWDLPINMSDT